MHKYEKEWASQSYSQLASQISEDRNKIKKKNYLDPEKKSFKKYSPGDQEHVFPASFLCCIKEYVEVRENG